MLTYCDNSFNTKKDFDTMNHQIENQHDLRQYEQNFPLNLPSSTYQMLCESEAQFGDKKALTFVLNAKQYQNSTSYSYRNLLAYIHQTANM